MRRRLAAIISGDEFEIATIPADAVELRDLVGSRQASAETALRVVQRAPQLAVRVLRRACVPTRGVPPTTNLREAVRRVGLPGLRDIARRAVRDGAFASEPLCGHAQREARHAFAVACGTALVARTLGVSQDDAFLCGLTHDVGRLALLSAVGQLGARERRWLQPAFLDALLDGYHEEVGARVLRRWELPTVVRDVAAHHHDIGIADSATNRLRSAVAIADAAAESAGDDARDRMTRLQAHEATLALGLSDRLLIRLIEVVDAA